MINLLVGLHAGKKLLPDMTIDPGQIEIQIGCRLDNKIPFHLLGDMLNNSILSF